MKKLILSLSFLPLFAIAQVNQLDIRTLDVLCDAKALPIRQITADQLNELIPQAVRDKYPEALPVYEKLALWTVRPCNTRSWITANVAISPPVSSTSSSSKKSSSSKSASSASSVAPVVGVFTGVVATASTVTPPNAATGVTDGDHSTRWESKWLTDPSWLILDLGSTKTLSSIAIDWEASNALSYTVEGSTNNSTWVPLASFTDGKFGDRTDVLVLQGNYRYLRITGTKRSVGSQEWGYSIFEVRVSGVITASASSSSIAPVTKDVTMRIYRPVTFVNGDPLPKEDIEGYPIRKSTGEPIVTVAASTVDPISYVAKLALGPTDFLEVATLLKTGETSVYIPFEVVK